MFVIEDDNHSEPQGEYSSLELAIEELKRRTTIPWDQAPNCAPCTSWKTCGRSYVIIEYDASLTPWKELQRVYALKVDASGVEWESDFEKRIKFN